VRRAVGAEVLPPATRAFAAAARITRVRLVGPNVHRDAHHVSQLAAEVPGIRELIFHQCVVNESAVRQVAMEMTSLRRVVLEGAWVWKPEQLLVLGHLPHNVAEVVIERCPLRDRNLGLLLRVVPWLSRIVLIDCDRVTRCGLEELQAHHPTIAIHHPLLGRSVDGWARAWSSEPRPYMLPTPVSLGAPVAEIRGARHSASAPRLAARCADEVMRWPVVASAVSWEALNEGRATDFETCGAEWTHAWAGGRRAGDLDGATART
jgi:hypothetical protein